MEVYIEYVIIDNFIMNYLILFFTKLTISSQIKKLNMFVSTLFGVVCAVMSPLISLNIAFILPIKLAIGIFMVLMLKKYANFKQFLVHLLLFFTYTFVFGGICFAILNMFNLKSTASGILINGFEIPMGLIMLLISIYVYFLLHLVHYAKNKTAYAGYYYDVTLKINNKKYYLRGYLDSGNKLYDNQTNLPVVVISFKTFCKLFSKLPLEKYFLNKPEELGLKDAHYITVENVVGGGKMLVFAVDEIQIKNQSLQKSNNKILLGVSQKSFSSEYECLLHSEFLKR